MDCSAVTVAEPDNPTEGASSSGKRKKAAPKKKPAKKAPKKKPKGKKTSVPLVAESPSVPPPEADKPSTVPANLPTVAEGKSFIFSSTCLKRVL